MCNSYNSHVYQNATNSISDFSDPNSLAHNDILNAVDYLPSHFILCPIPAEYLQHVGVAKGDSGGLNVGFHSRFTFNKNRCLRQISLDIKTPDDVPIPYGVFSHRLLVFICSNIKKSGANTSYSIHISDRFQFYKDVLGIKYNPSKEDIAGINRQLKALALAKWSFDFGGQDDYRKSLDNFNGINIFSEDVNWLWGSGEWEMALNISDEFTRLCNKHACPVSRQAQLSMHGRELQLFNYILYQNYCLSNNNYEVMEKPLFEIAQLLGFRMKYRDDRRNEHKIDSLLEKVSKKTGIKLIRQGGSVYIYVNQNSKLNNPLAKIANKDGVSVISEKYLLGLTTKFSEWDIKVARDYVEWRIIHGEELKLKQVLKPKGLLKNVLNNPYWYQKALDFTTKKIKQQQRNEFLKIWCDESNPFYSQLMSALNITSNDNLPDINLVSSPLQDQAIEQYNRIKLWIINKLHDNLEYHVLCVWKYVTRQCCDPETMRQIEILAAIPKVNELYKLYGIANSDTSSIRDK